MMVKLHNKIIAETLPVDIVYHPSWWHKHAGISFDEDFYFHPLKRVESEMLMEKILYDKFGEYGLGENHGLKRPEIGAVHNASGFMLSEMLGCKVSYPEDAAPQVIHLGIKDLSINQETPLKSFRFKKFQELCQSLKARFGYLTGDVNWGGILNLAMDLRGSEIMTDFYTNPDEVKALFDALSAVIETFVDGIQKETGTSSISVNRVVKHFRKPVFLHSECSHTMLSNELYEEFLLPFDLEWSRKNRPFGIHYCGPDPHRYAALFQKIPALDFLDVGWGGDIKLLREALPNTFLNIRLDPVSLKDQTNDNIILTIKRLVGESGNPYLTGVCCINMDDKVPDEKVITILETVKEIRKEMGDL